MNHSGRLDDYFSLVARLRATGAAVELRHDSCSCPTSRLLLFARAEAKRGLSATYYLLDDDPTTVEALAGLGHEVGVHHDGIATWLSSGMPPADSLRRRLDFMRRFASVTKTAAHGSPSCYAADGRLRFVEYEVFSEFDPERNVGGAAGWKFERVSAEGLGVREAYFGDHDVYLSDSGNAWHGWHGDPRPRPFERYKIDDADAALKAVGPTSRVQLLAHPAWWEVSK